MTYSNGNSYEGEWKLGVFEGHGKFQWVNGESYEGEYR
jgi:1-phosphatidylinositol-4-phosphate 5-kinase